MFRRQIINTIRRYSHQHCEKNIPQINLLKNNLITCNRYIENNEQKLDLIQSYTERLIQFMFRVV